MRWVNKVPYPRGWRITGAFIIGQILNLFYAFKSCDSLFVLFLIVLSEHWRVNRDPEKLSSRSLSHSLYLCLVRSVTFDSDGAVFTGRRKKRCRFLLLDMKTGGEVNTQSIVRPRAFSSAGNCQVSWWKKKKTNTYPSIQEEKLNLNHLVWIEAFLPSKVFAHVNN